MNHSWPALPLDDWQDTYRALHMRLQIVGKVRLALAPPVPHYWHVPLYVTPRGLTTSMMPHPSGRHLTIDFDLVDHELQIVCSDGEARTLPLRPQSVADFHGEFMALLVDMGLPVQVWSVPVEVPDPTPFADDSAAAPYDVDPVERLHAILRGTDAAFARTRNEFLGKTSPVHLFWGAFDLAVTRFNGDRNPGPPNDPVMGEAYSHAVISHGFWPGGDWPTGGRVDAPVLYAYAVPEPDGFRHAPVKPSAAEYREKLGEFVLPYDAARESADPAAAIVEFVRTTYAAAADAAGWDRAALERDGG